MICTMCGDTAEEMSYDEAWKNRALDLWYDKAQNVCVGCAEERTQRWADEDNANADLPEEQRICHTCHKSGQDDEGTYPSFYVQPWYQHAGCVDWDDVNKYGDD